MGHKTRFVTFLISWIQCAQEAALLAVPGHGSIQEKRDPFMEEGHILKLGFHILVH